MIVRQTHNIPQTIMIIEKRSSLLDDWQLPQVIDPCVQTIPLIPLQIIITETPSARNTKSVTKSCVIIISLNTQSSWSTHKHGGVWILIATLRFMNDTTFLRKIMYVSSEWIRLFKVRLQNCVHYTRCAWRLSYTPCADSQHATT